MKKEYRQAEKELRKKWDEFIAKSDSKIDALTKDLSAAQMSGATSEAKAIEKKLIQAKKNFTFGNARYNSMVDDITRSLADTNKAAVDMLNGKMSGIYVTNYNHIAAAAKQAGVSFNMVDQATVTRLIRDGKIKLPPRKMNIPKDMAWNKKKLNSAVLQGILQGESMDKIADRLIPVIGNNEKAAIRNARTMVTGAENRGRLDSYRNLDERGIVIHKVWIATGDDRTRDWHAEMDGQEVELDEMFIDGLGNELEYPGDPSAPGETVYNCRCAMRSQIIGFRKADGRIERI